MPDTEIEEQVYILINTQHKPHQVTIHKKICSFAQVFSAKKYNKEDWPNSSDYYIVGCNHCKPNL